MVESLLIMLREGFEAALVVAIVFAYLRKIDRPDLRRPAWMGVLAALGIAVAFGLIIEASVGELVGQARMRAFAAICFAALVVLTWMIFWMRRQSRMIKGELQERIDDAVHSTNVAKGMILVTFAAVLREGIESALFLLAATTASSSGDVLIGGIIGLALAIVLGYAVYRGGRVIPMSAFFTITGLIIIVFAAGLASKTVFFLQHQGSGDFGSVNDAVFNLTGVHWLTTESQVGRFLSGLFGWDPRPSAEQALAWLLYIVPVTIAFLWPAPRIEAPPASKQPSRELAGSASTTQPAGT